MLRGAIFVSKVMRMSTAVQIEAAIRELPLTEARAIAQWLDGYLSGNDTKPTPIAEHLIAKWRGRGRLPSGQNADEYLRLIRDGTANR
jgi:hypothetical protein